MSKKQPNNFLLQGSILAIAGIIVRIIGLVYRVPMQNILGPSGAGLYNSAFTVYTILLLLSSYSLPLAVSKMVSSHISVGEYKNTHRILKATIILAVGIGLVMALICFLGAGFFSKVLLKEEDAAIAIRAISPCIFIMALLGVMRGFFQGLGSMVPTAISQIIEQIFNAIFSLVGAYFLAESGMKISEDMRAAYGAAGGTIGTTVGAAMALLFLAFVYMLYRNSLIKKMKRDMHTRAESFETIARTLVSMSLPVILSTTVYNIGDLIDQSIYAYSLEGSYMETWGIYTGIYCLLVNLPIAVSNAMASAAVPTLTKAVTNKNRQKAVKEVSMTIRFTMIIAIPCTVGFMVLAHPIVEMLFKEGTELGGNLLFAGACTVLFFSLSTVTNGILQGINHMTTPVKNACIAMAVHILILVLCLYPLKMGIYGVLYAHMIFGVLMCYLNWRCIADFLQYDQEIFQTFVLPAAASLVMGIVCFAFYSLIHLITSNIIASTLIAILVSIIVYGVMLLVLRCVGEEELSHFPMGDRIADLARSFNLL